jgi:hypothetical protein
MDGGAQSSGQRRGEDDEDYEIRQRANERVGLQIRQYVVLTDFEFVHRNKSRSSRVSA